MNRQDETRAKKQRAKDFAFARKIKEQGLSGELETWTDSKEKTAPKLDGLGGIMLLAFALSFSGLTSSQELAASTLTSRVT